MKPSRFFLLVMILVCSNIPSGSPDINRSRQFSSERTLMFNVSIHKVFRVGLSFISNLFFADCFIRHSHVVNVGCLYGMKYMGYGW